MINVDNHPNPDSELLPDQMTYEQSLNELERIVAALETEELPLETSLALYERGQTVSRRCAALLDQAELRVRQLAGENLVDFEG